MGIAAGPQRTIIVTPLGRVAALLIRSKWLRGMDAGYRETAIRRICDEVGLDALDRREVTALVAAHQR
jgi:hypothetical protein